MRKLILIFALAATASLGLAACSSKSVYGGMIGAGVGGLNGNATSGMLIGAGIGGMLDAMDD